MIYNKTQSLYDLFKNQLKKNPNSLFLFDKKNSGWMGISYLEIHKKVESLQYYLFTKKVCKGDRVFLLSSNRSEWFIIDIAIQSIGAVTVPAFTTNNIGDNEFILKDCRPKLIFVENEKLLRRNAKIFNQKFIREIICIESHKNTKSLKNIFEEKGNCLLPSISREDISSIIYTSGTSGRPKGVVLSHKSLIHNCFAAYKILKDLNFKKEKFLSFLPLSHSYERMAGLYFPLFINARVYFCKKMENIMTDFKEINPTLITAVPRFYESIYKKIYLNIKKSNLVIKYFYRMYNESNPKKQSVVEKICSKFFFFILKKKIKNLFGENLKTFVSGGAALDPKISRFFDFLDISILQGYGQTEAGPLISCNTLKNNDSNTVGYPIWGIEVKISHDREILIKGPNVMVEYWKNEELTREVLKKKWLYTGDLGYFDKQERLIIDGRKKELIVTSGGENISPQKIENFFQSYTEILQTVIFGNAKPFLIGIFSVEKNIDRSRIKEIVDEVNRELNSVEKIRKFIIADEPFTFENQMLTQTYKIRKKEVFKTYRKSIINLYSKS